MLNGIYTCMFILYIKCQLDENQLFSVRKVSIGQELIVSATSKSTSGEGNSVTTNCDTIVVVVEQEYHQGGCALREK